MSWSVLHSRDVCEAGGDRVGVGPTKLSEDTGESKIWGKYKSQLSLWPKSSRTMAGEDTPFASFGDVWHGIL